MIKMKTSKMTRIVVAITSICMLLLGDHMAYVAAKVYSTIYNYQVGLFLYLAFFMLMAVLAILNCLVGFQAADEQWHDELLREELGMDDLSEE